MVSVDADHRTASIQVISSARKSCRPLSRSGSFASDRVAAAAAQQLVAPLGQTTVVDELGGTTTVVRAGG
jgi:hypothetical protein